MSTNFFVEVLSKTPYRDISGGQYCIWCYRISWNTPAPELKPRVGLIFSSRIDIKDPTNYPDIPTIQSTRVAKIPGDDKQYVFQDITPSKASGKLDLCFLAPCAEDSFAPVILGTVIPEAGQWVFLPYRTETEGPVSLTHTILAPSVVCPATGQRPPSTQLDNSIRRIEKGTHVALKLDTTSDAAPELGNALLKYGYIRQLSLQPGEVSEVKNRLSSGTRMRPAAERHSPASDLFHWLESFLSGMQSKTENLPSTSDVWKILEAFEGSPLPSLLPERQVFSAIPASALKSFGEVLQQVRQEAVKEGAAATTLSTTEMGSRLYLLHAAAVANKGFTFNSGQSPVGMLNLERIEMAPAGIERGGLIATIPLAPLEETAVIQKEWSVTTKEFTSIVTDSLESISETGVTDNTELAQSTTSQAQHANQFNITGTVTGGIPVIHGSVTSSFGAQDTNSQSATESRKHAVTLTQKASSRVKKEHKVTISTTTVTGTAETTTRTLKNPSSTDPIRIDYFSLMRKWQVRLYRYGLRLTYDIVIPEPAGALRATYADLDFFSQKIRSFHFDVTHDFIANASFQDIQKLGDKYGTSVPLPPSSVPPFMWVGKNVSESEDEHWRFYDIEFDVPPGSEISNVFYDGYVGSVGVAGRLLTVVNYGDVPIPGGGHNTLDLGSFLVGATGHQVITFRLIHVDIADIKFKISVQPTQQARAQWVMDVWNALYNAAQTQYYAEQQDIAARIAQLEDQLNNVDTLTLRREESEEVMKGALRFLLGYGFDFMPQEVIDAIKNSGADVDHGVGFTGNSLGLDPGNLALVRQDEDRVRFINQAIEWENVVTFLYSYFWDVPNSWDFIRKIKHPDALRQAFLRAGSARVVLTVRKGWETAWTGFVESGFPDGPSPYLTIAQEIAAYDDHNYPGIPPANPGPRAARLEDSVYTTSSTVVTGPQTNVEIEVESSVGFAVGADVVIDSGVYADPTITTGKQERTTITAIRDETHITLASIQYSHGRDENEVLQPYAIVWPGEKGALIAEWFEYTPTSGTDIAVTSNLAIIA